MFIYINNYCFSPAKQEVSHTSANNHSNTQPSIVRHEDQHQAVTDENLDHV